MFDLLIVLVFSFGATLAIGGKAINVLRSLQGRGQPIRDDGPASHFSKVGTPTMGGLIIIGCVLLSTAIFCQYTNAILLLSFVMITYGAIGFMDDYAKVKKQTTNGIKAKLRLAAEFSVAGIVLYCIKGSSTQVTIPFIATPIEFGWLYYILASMAIVGTANSTNLTDGLDGLLIVPTIIIFSTFIGAIYMLNAGIYPKGKFPVNLSSDEIYELIRFCVIFIGVSLGFLWFNSNPASIFMGDVGSLAIGGAIGTLAVILHQEIFLIIGGGVFVAEALSVMIQVGSYRMRKKRVFLMAPIHHHFEKMGLPENKVVARFWIVSLLLGLFNLYLTTL